MHIENIKLDRIKPYENNPRDNRDAIDKVAASIKEFGFQQPIVVDKNFVIIVGHTRYQAAHKLGLIEVPVLIADKLSDEQVRAYRLADNKTAEYSYWDWEKLENEFRALQTSSIDLDSLGFDVDFDELNADITDDMASGENVTHGNAYNTESNGNNGNAGIAGNEYNGGSEDDDDTEEFAKIDETIKTNHRCPMCGYEW